MGDLVLAAKDSHLSTGEVCSIVGYDGMWKAKVTNEILPHEF